ncbi:putative elongation factor 2 [Monocercomonoides exilis]|uniref:putative elongation factor 2 n=1 Tax=Monocercomonoides exilis TaxID=2049356 RepID=UPI00355A12B5|nr:putative elongation factor 2 [Monocercomonoides exilis]|eukprot:MONOS_298.1-p1 / transcript=MONOS_298.1 / gene=MONOS_298 / organism=Monocercomonoides_exilis_PA203 / gene_product=elongation factor 2 / transcript_product=elongation factor 2 / location=Mono_scaffold00005:61485-63998(+) / protein_length=837 / sequence_SO=supercontig / SO=protein_coding / is_pseudo=false
MLDDVSTVQFKADFVKKENIRNISFVSHVEHGKSTLIDALVSKAGIIRSLEDGQIHFSDILDEEKSRGFSIKSTLIPLFFEKNFERKLEKYVINTIDTPGHVDLSSEVTTALRLTDGAVVVVDPLEGVCIQTESVLKQILNEHVIPILMLNKIDRMISEHKHDPEEIYQKCFQTIKDINAIVASYGEEMIRMKEMDPIYGTVIFGSGELEFGFTLEQMAKMYEKKLGTPAEIIIHKFWGDWYFNPFTKKWQDNNNSGIESNPKLKRGFVQFVLEPIIQLFEAVMKGNIKILSKILGQLNICLSSEELQAKEQHLEKSVMNSWIPVADALLEAIILHLPSPVEAQRYRMATLYSGPLDDECATAIRTCDPEGPLMIFISKLIPVKEQFLAFGRVYSGTVRSGMTVYIQGKDHVPGKKDDIVAKSINECLLCIGNVFKAVEEVPCGNIVCLSGLEEVIKKTATVTNSKNACNFVEMRFSVSPVVRVAVEPKEASDLPKLLEGLRRLSQSDPLCQVSTSDTGEHIIAGSGELHLEICLKDLKDNFMGGTEIKMSQPIVQYCESVTTTSSQICLVKSPHKQARLFASAEPLSEELVDSLDRGKCDQLSCDDAKLSEYLVNSYEWNAADAKQIWCFGPNENATNVLVDQTRGAYFHDTTKEAIKEGFKWVTANGVLCGELMRGVRFNIIDASFHASPERCGRSQMIQPTRRCLYASELCANPALLEPVYLAEIIVPSNFSECTCDCLRNRRGMIISEELRAGTSVMCIKAHLPVSMSFGFAAELRAKTAGQALPQCALDHWQKLSGDVYDPSSQSGAVVKFVRKFKGLAEALPNLEELTDKI